VKFIPRTRHVERASMSASGKMTIGFFPPSSRVTVFTATSAALRWRNGRSRCFTNEGDTSHAGIGDERVSHVVARSGDHIDTPAGKITMRSSTRARIDREVNSLGFKRR